jgi:hypothetical protein
MMLILFQGKQQLIFTQIFLFCDEYGCKKKYERKNGGWFFPGTAFFMYLKKFFTQ